MRPSQHVHREWPFVAFSSLSILFLRPISSRTGDDERDHDAYDVLPTKVLGHHSQVADPVMNPTRQLLFSHLKSLAAIGALANHLQIQVIRVEFERSPKATNEALAA